ncbi:hypothetical protein LWI28_024252 [Acer negundo]|uniref:Uncharacterized protein n=1 Tax=Acer negundo TaxID=4023 RepID=A0AAD5I859_ACENE|nr:hypothetical protein LWI28_024252 [Acer negundo]KAK4834728.1 hypothetical protein QYF36_027368 [Acer negundo]
MNSVCISNCVNDTRDPRARPVRATYVNLYKWPESDAEFVRSVTSRGGAAASNVRRGLNNAHHPRVVDSISCRQMYLRSYTFSREEDHQNSDDEKTTAAMCFGGGRGREKKKKEKETATVAAESKNNRKKQRSSSKDQKKSCRRNNNKRKCLVLRKMSSCSALLRIFYRLLSCSASVDVVDHQN